MASTERLPADLRPQFGDRGIDRIIRGADRRDVGLLPHAQAAADGLGKRRDRLQTVGDHDLEQRLAHADKIADRNPPRLDDAAHGAEDPGLPQVALGVVQPGARLVELGLQSRQLRAGVVQRALGRQVAADQILDARDRPLLVVQQGLEPLGVGRGGTLGVDLHLVVELRQQVAGLDSVAGVHVD
jgi:hypothetical protein